jgi:hypothetical protein
VIRALVCVLLLAGAAHADDTRPATQVAQERLDAGTRAFKDKDFARASTEFAAGFAAEPWSGFLFAWAQSERLRGDCPSALKLYARFISTSPPDAVRQLADDGVAACGGVSEPEPEPPPKPIIEQPPRRDPPPPSPIAPPRFRHKLALGLAVGALASGAAGITLLVQSRGDQQASGRATTHPDAVVLYDRAQQRLRGAQIAGGLAVAFATAATLRFTLSRDDRAAIAVSPTTITLVARW